VDYAQVIKMYGPTPSPAGRYSPGHASGIATTFMNLEEILVRVDAAQTPKARGPYKKRAAL
jgi:hypothetical protein